MIIEDQVYVSNEVTGLQCTHAGGTLVTYDADLVVDASVRAASLPKKACGLEKPRQAYRRRK